ncbi:MAG TPA: cyclodeaminase/cyclohydrolase family protein [Vicinamibacterales bacterium]|nr:cyclodeaminase/cyclohydrolase family protein [Vicinamibacterales bacterium]
MTSGYATTSIADLLDSLASADPAPGGGAAAALAGAMGVSLLLMVASMNKTRTGAPEEMTDLAAAAARLRLVRDELTTLVATDPEAYRQVLTAYRLPKASADEQAARRSAIASAMRAATDAPLHTIRACVSALRESVLITSVGNPNAITDAAVGVHLLIAAVRSGAMNVEINIKGMTDAAYAAAATAERKELIEQGEALASEALAHALPRRV